MCKYLIYPGKNEDETPPEYGKSASVVIYSDALKTYRGNIRAALGLRFSSTDSISDIALQPFVCIRSHFWIFAGIP